MLNASFFQVFLAGAIGPLDTLLAVGLPDGKVCLCLCTRVIESVNVLQAIAARTLQKLADPVEVQ